MSLQILPPTIKKIIQKYKNTLESHNIHVQDFFIFGSQVNGKPKPYSDIDIAVISPQLQGDKTEAYVKLQLLSHDIDWRIEPHPFSPEDFSIDQDPFVDEIKRTGIKV